MTGAETNPFLRLASSDRLYGTRIDDADTLKSNPRRVAVDLLRLFLAARTPLTLWGPVGARKTRTIEALSREKDADGVPFQVITIQPSTQDPTIIHGIMYTSPEPDGSVIMKRSIPDVAKQIVEYNEETGGYTVLFGDEMTTCMPAQQNAMLGLLTHGKFEGIDISPYMTIAMAANPEGTVSSVTPLSEAVINRGGHIAWYGDVKLFLEDWNSGFHGATDPPDPLTSWYVNNLLEGHGDEAFRNERWTPDGLVPWDLIEHTERSVTETGNMITLVNDVFSGAPDSVRRHYIVEVTRALLGGTWADRIADITSLEGQALSHRRVVEKIRAARVTLSTTTEELKSLIGDTLYVTDEGIEMQQDQAYRVMENLVKRAYDPERLVFDQDMYVSAWALAATARTNSESGNFHRPLTHLIQRGMQAADQGAVEKKDLVPMFVSSDLISAVQASGRSA